MPRQQCPEKLENALVKRVLVAAMRDVYSRQVSGRPSSNTWAQLAELPAPASEEPQRQLAAG